MSGIITLHGSAPSGSIGGGNLTSSNPHVLANNSAVSAVNNHEFNIQTYHSVTALAPSSQLTVVPSSSGSPIDVLNVLASGGNVTNALLGVTTKVNPVHVSGGVVTQGGIVTQTLPKQDFNYPVQFTKNLIKNLPDSLTPQHLLSDVQEGVGNLGKNIGAVGASVGGVAGEIAKDTTSGFLEGLGVTGTILLLGGAYLLLKD